MKKYLVGIFVEGEIEAECDIDAIHDFMENVSYKDCYVEEIGKEEEGEQE